MTSYNDKTYLMIGGGDGFTFEEADMRCRSNDGNLATVGSQGEHDKAVDALSQIYLSEAPDSTTQVQFWLGYKEDDSGSLAAVDGSDTDYITSEGLTTAGGECVYGAAEDGSTAEFSRGSCGQPQTAAMCEISTCSRCGLCVEQLYNRFTSSIDSSEPVSRRFSTLCTSELGYPRALCSEAAFAIASSIVGDEGALPNLAQQPAAICAILDQDCSGLQDECQIRSNGGGSLSLFATEINYCTEDGTTSSPVVGSLEYPSSSGCLRDSDCSTDEFCSKSTSNGTSIVFRCNPEDGRDVSAATGECKSLCEQSQFVQRKERIANLYNNTCDPEDGGEPCPGRCEEPSIGCIEPESVTCEVVDGGVQISAGRPCKGQCLGSLDKTLSSARFTNEGDGIIVQLGTPADTLQTSCDTLFEATAADRLGNATCSVSSDERNVLHISLAGNEQIQPEQDLALKQNSGLTAFHLSDNDQFDSSTVTVERCTDCAKPVARITGSPTQATRPCTGETPDGVDIDGKASTDPSGRPFIDVTWMSTLELDSSCTSTDALQSDIDRANRDMSLVLRLQNSTMDDLPAGRSYCVSLKVTSFLGVESDYANHTLLMKESQSVPVVSMTLDSSYTLPSSGLRLTGEVSIPSVCEGLEVVFKWTCERRVTSLGLERPCDILQENTWQDNILAVVSDAALVSAGIVPGDQLQMKLQARFSTKNETTDAMQGVLIEGAPLVAAFTDDSPEGAVFQDQSNLTFSASASYDPSDPNNRNPLDFSFGCAQLDGSSCFNFTDGYYNGEQDGSTWVLDPERFVNAGPNAWYIISVLVSKGSGSTLRESLATRFINIRRPFEEILGISIVRDCLGICPSAHLSSRPLSLYLDLDVDVERLDSITWEVNGHVLQERDTLAGGQSTRNVSSTAITLTPSFLPRAGEISIVCNVTSILGGTEAVSASARTSVLLVGPPVCTAPNGNCLRLPESSATLPNVEFTAEAVGFSGAQPLHYEFGFIEDGSMSVLHPASSESSAVLHANDGPKTYTVYTVCVDSLGGTSDPATAQFTLESPTIIVVPVILDRILLVNLTQLESTGDNKAILIGINTIAALLRPLLSSNSTSQRSLLSSQPWADASSNWHTMEHDMELPMVTRRSLMQGNNDREEAVDDSLDQLQAILNEEAAGLPEALEVLTSLRDLLVSEDSLTLSQAAQAGEIARTALDVIDGSRSTSISVSVIQAGLKSAGMAAEVLAGEGYEDSWQTVERLRASLTSARNILRRNAPAGVTTFARDERVSLAVSRNTLTGTVQANIDNLAVDVLGREDDIEAGVYMPADAQQDFLSWCRNDTTCSNQRILAFYISYVRDSEVFTAANENFAGALNSLYGYDVQAEVASGVLQTQFDFKPEDTPLCDSNQESGCALTLILPVNGGVSTDGRLAACVRLTRNMVDQTYIPEIVQDGFTLGTAHTMECNTNSLGRHMLVTYSQPPSPPDEPAEPPTEPEEPPGQSTSPAEPPTDEAGEPPGPPEQETEPSLPPSPRPPSQVIDDGDADVCTGGARASIYIMFDRNFEESNNPDFRTRILTQFSSNLYSMLPSYFTHGGPEQCPNFVSVELSPGSVVAAFSISLGEGSTEEAAEELEAEVADTTPNAPSRLFEDQDLIDSVTEISKESPKASSSSGTLGAQLRGAMVAFMVVCLMIA